MKKITLAFLVLIALSGKVLSQPIVSLNAPAYDGASSTYAISDGSVEAAYHRGAFLIKASELTGLVTTNSVINTAVFNYLQGVNSGASATGQFTLWFQNTSDVTYNKGTTWSTITTGMQQVYNGNYTIPSGAASAAVTRSLTLISSPGFTWTGGGIYVAMDWSCPSANATQLAVVACNSQGLANGAVRGFTNTPGSLATLVVPAATAVNSSFRPSLNLLAQNTASNELSVIAMAAPGYVAKGFNTSHTVTAYVRNNSVGALSNVSVALGVGGANLFGSVVTIPSIGAGSIALVTFAPFNPTVSGLNSMTVSVPQDQQNSNNALTWSQSVTCVSSAMHPAGFAYSTAYATGSAGGCVTSKYNFPSNCSLSDVLFNVATFSANTGAQMYAVAIDNTGAILATSNTVVINSGAQSKFVFNPPVALTSGTDYYIGVAQPTAGYYPFAYGDAPTLTADDYYYVPLAGGSAPVAWGIPNGYLGITANVLLPNLTISAAATRTRVCNKSAESTTLNLTGQTGMTYSWSTGSTSSTSIVVSPSVTGVSGAVNYTVTGTDPVTGCKSNAAVVTVSVANCTGLVNNSTFGSNLAVYPNPAVNGKVNISGLEGSTTITVFNVIGQAVLSFNSNEENAVIDLNNQPAGNYLVKISNASNESRTIKIVTQN